LVEHTIFKQATGTYLNTQILFINNKYLIGKYCFVFGLKHKLISKDLNINFGITLKQISKLDQIINMSHYKYKLF